MLELVRFYPSLTAQDIINMTPQKVKYYRQGMEIIEARERLKMMDAVSYVHLNKSDRRKKHRQLNKVAYPARFKKQAIKTSDLELI